MSESDASSSTLHPSGQQCAVLVINLDRAHSRLAFQQAQAERLGVAFERIPAIDGTTLPPEVYRRHAFRWQRVMAPNEVACLLSHAKCWEHVAATGQNTLVLEDDTVLAENIRYFLEKAAALNGAEIVNFETRGAQSFVSRTALGLHDLELYRLMAAVSGSAAYLVTPKAARILLDGLPGKAGLADNYVWGRKGITHLQTDPGLCMGLDIMLAHHNVGEEEAARSNIAFKRPPRSKKLLSYIQHPLTAWRRCKAQVSLGFKKLVLPWFADYRVVAPHPTIFASYKALKGSTNG